MLFILPNLIILLFFLEILLLQGKRGFYENPIKFFVCDLNGNEEKLFDVSCRLLTIDINNLNDDLSVGIARTCSFLKR